MKHFTIAGRLGGTPQLETKGEGSDRVTWARMRIAVNSGQDKPDWFWVTAFGKLAENVAKHLAKGDGPVGIYRRYVKQFYPPVAGTGDR